MAACTAISVEQAIARFKERYPTGFEDERYVTLERGWKWEKHVEWHERVSTRSLAEMAKTNLRQLAHDTLPFALRRVSKKSRRPSRAATVSSPYRLDGSAGSESRLASESERSCSRSSADQRPPLAA